MNRIYPTRADLVLTINRHFHTSLCKNRNTNLSRQSKIFEKLLGHRESGSKKRWYPSELNDSQPAQLNSARDIIKSQNKQGKNGSRRINVLNKLFMKHITDQLATGTVSEEILGKGLEISRVKVTPDFNGVNVYWIANGGLSRNDSDIEETLHRCSGILRHELSQLRLMGEVPRIYFVKDKLYANMADVEDVLKHCDLGDYDEEIIPESELDEANSRLDCDLPHMRHDVLGLDHTKIMTGILAKMKKSKDAWSAFEAAEEHVSTTPKSQTPRLDILRKKMEENREREFKFNKLLNVRKYKPATPDRKRPIQFIDENEIFDEQEEVLRKENRDFMDVGNRKNI